MRFVPLGSVAVAACVVYTLMAHGSSAQLEPNLSLAAADTAAFSVSPVSPVVPEPVRERQSAKRRVAQARSPVDVPAAALHLALAAGAVGPGGGRPPPRGRRRSREAPLPAAVDAPAPSSPSPSGADGRWPRPTFHRRGAAGDPCHGRGVYHPVVDECRCTAGWGGRWCELREARPCNVAIGGGILHRESLCAGHCDEDRGICYCAGFELGGG
jgi:hypothetical protein